ncbi:MAG: tetratricopeptide repeat protein [Alphaproteobacteria bacterium]
MHRALLAFMLAIATPVAAQAGYLAGVHAFNDGDFATAFAELAPLAEDGNTSAQYYLGQMYLTGRGVERDEARAFVLLSAAAEAGDARAQVNMGLFYESGRMVERDLSTAASWFAKAAEAGMPFAQTKLGVLYQRGAGLALDYDRARELYQAAAAQGDVYALRNLGYLYENGLGVEQDYDEAERWYRAAMAEGYPGAMNNLAWMLAARQVRLDEALELAQHAVDLHPTPTFIDTLGYVHFQRGEYEAAVAAYERSLAMFDGDWSVIARLGDAYNEVGEVSKAQETWQRALGAAPAGPERDALVKKLEESQS